MQSEKNLCDSTGKVCYSKRKAGEIINDNRKHRKSDHLGKNKKIPKRSYMCRGCGSYHLTHEPYLKTSGEKQSFYLSEG